MLEGLAAAGSSIFGGMLGLAGMSQEKVIADQNLQFQKDNLEYLKGVQAETWKREDTAVRRRARDLTAAGLSKTLAAGSAASSGPVVHTEAPQYKGDPVGKFTAGAQAGTELVRGLISGVLDISKTQAEAERLRADAEVARETVSPRIVQEHGKSAALIMENKVRHQNERRLMQEYDIRKKDSDWWYQKGMPSNTGFDMTTRSAALASSVLVDIERKLVDWINAKRRSHGR